MHAAPTNEGAGFRPCEAGLRDLRGRQLIFAIWGVKCEFHIFLAGKFKLLCPSFDAKLCFVVVLVIWQLSELGNCGV